MPLTKLFFTQRIKMRTGQKPCSVFCRPCAAPVVKCFKRDEEESP